MLSGATEAGVRGEALAGAVWTDCPYDWIPDLPDPRDHRYSASRRVLVKTPLRIDLRPTPSPTPWKGFPLSSAAHAIRHGCSLEAATLLATRLGLAVPARLPDETCPFEQLLTPAIGAQSGLRETFKAVIRQMAGRSPNPASPAGNTGAAMTGITPSYLRLSQTLAQFKGCLAEGHPFVFGCSVFETIESLEVRRSGRIPMPDTCETMLGGQAGVALGYDDAKRAFIVLMGQPVPVYRYLPYSYLVDPALAADFWTLRLTVCQGQPAFRSGRMDGRGGLI